MVSTDVAGGAYMSESPVGPTSLPRLSVGHHLSMPVDGSSTVSSTDPRREQRRAELGEALSSFPPIGDAAEMVPVLGGRRPLPWSV